LEQVISDTGKCEQSSRFQPEAHTHIHYMLWNPPCPTADPALSQPNTTEKFTLPRSMYFSASPHSVPVSCKLNHDRLW